MQAVLSPQLQEATHSLIENLLASEAFTRYGQARARLDTDQEARSLLEQLAQCQARLRQKQAQGAVNQEDIDELRGIQTKVQRNRVIMDYAQSQQEAVNFLRQVNAEIGQLLGVDFAALANQNTC